MKKDVKGLSPVIATVLLITMVIVIALIIFLWIRGMTQEAITKFDNENVQLVCGKVSFEASYEGNTLGIRNSGNVPIFRMDIKVIDGGEHFTENIIDVSDAWPELGLNSGGTFSDNTIVFAGEEIVLIPVLMGESEEGMKTYVCKDEGYNLLI